MMTAVIERKVDGRGRWRLRSEAVVGTEANSIDVCSWRLGPTLKHGDDRSTVQPAVRLCGAAGLPGLEASLALLKHGAVVNAVAHCSNCSRTARRMAAEGV